MALPQDASGRAGVAWSGSPPIGSGCRLFQTFCSRNASVLAVDLEMVPQRRQRHCEAPTSAASMAANCLNLPRHAQKHAMISPYPLQVQHGACDERAVISGELCMRMQQVQAFERSSWLLPGGFRLRIGNPGSSICAFALLSTHIHGS